jgi:hypothetical protein
MLRLVNMRNTTARSRWESAGVLPPCKCALLQPKATPHERYLGTGGRLAQGERRSAELFRLSELLCGFHHLTTSSKFYYLFTNRRVAPTAPNSALRCCPARTRSGG